MYIRYFGLHEYPFGLTSDLRFFYKTPLHEEVHSSIVTTIRARKGLVLLTGEPGTGKTTLLHRLAQTLGDSAQILWLPLAAPTFGEILTYLCEQCALSCSPHDDVDTTLTRLREHLLKSPTHEKTVVLFIDEAQRLDPETLRQLFHLIRLEGPHGKVLQIVLAGHPELEENLAHLEAQLLRQHLASWQRLSPFPNECIEAYIHHRLTVAGCDRFGLFTPEAIRTVGLYSHAIPRLINVICDNALLTAYRLDLHTIPLEVIVQVVDDLQLSAPSSATNEQRMVHSTGASRMTPQKLLVALRTPLQPLAWISVGIVIGWLTAFPQPFNIQTAHLSEEKRGIQAPLQDSSLASSVHSDARSPSQEVQSLFHAFGTPASTLLPSAVPVAAAVLERQEPVATTTIPTKSENPSSLGAIPPVQPSSSSSPSITTSQELPHPTSTTPHAPVNSEVARIIEILKHPVAPSSPASAAKYSPSAFRPSKAKRSPKD